MDIRSFKREDFPKLLNLAMEMWMESPVFRKKTMDQKKLLTLAERILSNPEQMCGFVAVNSGGIEGFFMGFITEFYFGPEKVASDLALFVSPDHRGGRTASKLLKAFENWAFLRGANEISLGITTGVNQASTQLLYNYLGFKTSGVICKKQIRDS